MSGVAKPAGKPAGKRGSLDAIRAAWRSRLASWTVLATLAAAGGGGFYALWQYVGPWLLAQDEYRLSYDEIQITAPPEWIRADVKMEVLRDASLEGGLSLFDEPGGRAPLTQRLAEAFTLHPWVERVTRVVKSHPARVDVELVYRRPVCMVEIPGGLYPVDAAGVVLPTGDFLMNRHRQLEALRYPRLVEIGTLPVGLVGQPWGDSRVAAGARLAGLLFDDWQALKLAKMVAVGSAARGDESWELFTAAGKRIRWGRPPGLEASDQPPAAEKLARLKKYAADHGSLDAGPDAREIDLRPLAPPAPPPLTANRDGAEPR